MEAQHPERRNKPWERPPEGLEKKKEE